MEFLKDYAAKPGTDELKIKRNRLIAVDAALQIIHAHAGSSGSGVPPESYEKQIAKLADAIQEAISKPTEGH